MTDVAPAEAVAVPPQDMEQQPEQEANGSEPQQDQPEGDKPDSDPQNTAGDAVQAVEEPEGETAPRSPDHKRKHANLEAAAEDKAAEGGVGESESVEAVKVAEDLVAADGSAPDKVEGVLDEKVDACDESGDPKRQKLDDQQPDGLALEEQNNYNSQSSVPDNGQIPLQGNLSQPLEDASQKTNATISQQGHADTEVQGAELQTRKVDIPNTKVGVLIGKSGDTIRYLQYNSGAKIQITRDSEVDPDSSTRPVELVGTLESVIKAEQLIKEVIAEAEAGGQPNLVARGIGLHSGAEQLEIRVPNDKVGVIIGKGGEMIKNLQTRSGARIQLIPQHLPEGDTSKERTVRISGNKKQIEAAADLVKEVMSQARPSSLFSGYGRGRGHQQPHWGPRAMTPNHPPAGYDYQQRGPYPSQNQYSQSYGGGYQQLPPRGNYNGGWEQRPYQAPPQSGGGFGYYGPGGPSMDNNQTSGPVPGAASAAAPPNYYGQQQGSTYPQQPAHYPQSAPAQQSYGQGYNEPAKYDGHTPNQQPYGQQPVASHPGQYPQQGVGQPVYSQPAYDNKPAYGGPQQASQGYGPGTVHPGNQMYPSQNPPQQQTYPYGATAAPTQQYGSVPVASAQTYGGTPGASDAYAQQTSAAYPQQSQVAPGYVQTSAPVYAQTAQPTGVYQQGAGYAQYPTQQPTYSEQPQAVQSNQAYGYQQAATTATGYASGAPAAYGAPQPAAGAVAYAQPAPANPAGYEQQVPPQTGYAVHPTTAPAGYA